MRPKNKKICLSGEEALAVLSEINLILMSLHRMGSTYSEGGREYEQETTRFIDEWQVCSRLANVRKILSSKFDNTLGPDDMDDVERAMESLPFWRSSTTKAPD